MRTQGITNIFRAVQGFEWVFHKKIGTFPTGFGEGAIELMISQILLLLSHRPLSCGLAAVFDAGSRLP